MKFGPTGRRSKPRRSTARGTNGLRRWMEFPNICRPCCGPKNCLRKRARRSFSKPRRPGPSARAKARWPANCSSWRGRRRPAAGQRRICWAGKSQDRSGRCAGGNAFTVGQRRPMRRFCNSKPVFCLLWQWLISLVFTTVLSLFALVRTDFILPQKPQPVFNSDIQLRAACRADLFLAKVRDWCRFAGRNIAHYERHH